MCKINIMDNMIDKEGVTPIKKKKKFVYLEKYETQMALNNANFHKLNSKINELYISVIILSVACAVLAYFLIN